ncbi:MAG: formylglycine-generating enzyme family protein [Bacteroidota bacterium]
MSHIFRLNRNVFLLLFLLINCSIPEESKQKDVSLKNDQVGTNDPQPEPTDGPEGMVWIPGGVFIMGALDEDGQARRDEYPAHEVALDGFWMDTTEVTNTKYQAFVKATGYVTTAEKKLDWEEIKKQVPPGTPKPADSVFQPSSMVFTPVKTDNLSDWSQWWSWVEGANWKHPQGPESTIMDKKDHPVVQVSWDDVVAYLNWAGKRLPTEAEWEFAARGGTLNKLYPWGANFNEITQCGNTWEGKFPENNTLEDGYFTTAPVGSYRPNGFGLYDMAGNVWEWTQDWYNVNYYQLCSQNGRVTNPQGPDQSYDPRNPYMPQRVQRGGSFLCNESYCSSYRVSARMQSSPDTGLDHVGFRGVMSQEQWLAMQE